MASVPARDPVADLFRRRLPMRTAYTLVRWKNVLLGAVFYRLSRRAPKLMRSFLRKGAVANLPAGYDVDTHFNPHYNPWDQRMCLIPDGDLFRSISDGRASVVTDTIETFTEHGIRLTSGTELPADVIVTATGLNLIPIGGLTLYVDGSPVDIPNTVAYKGMMLSDVPNFALAVGYTNASWTLKCDLVAEYVCRVLNYLDAHDLQVCTPVAPDTDERIPLIDLNSGYVRRSVDHLPKQGPAAPWRLYQNYPRDVLMLRYRSVRDKGVRFSRRPAPARTQAPVAR